MTTRFLLAGAAALALAACGNETEEPLTDDVAVAEQDALATDAATADSAMPANAQDFASAVAASDMYEIEAGRLAEQNGQSQAVKDFGAMMVEDHTKSTADLKAAAGQVNGVTVNPQMTAEQQSNLEALRSAGTNFDTVYKQQQVAAHEKTLSMLRDYGQNGDAAPLKDFATKAAGIVEGHLEQARNLT